MPHGPAHAVNGPMPANIQGPLIWGGGGKAMADGCPESMSDMSGSGPSGPILWGVWQSWQPLMSTRYLPRATMAALAPAGFAAATFFGAAGAVPACADTPLGPAAHITSPIAVVIATIHATRRPIALALICAPPSILHSARLSRGLQRSTA